jgi:hypothetical protein
VGLRGAPGLSQAQSLPRTAGSCVLEKRPPRLCGDPGARPPRRSTAGALGRALTSETHACTLAPVSMWLMKTLLQSDRIFMSTCAGGPGVGV